MKPIERRAGQAMAALALTAMLALAACGSGNPTAPSGASPTPSTSEPVASAAPPTPAPTQAATPSPAAPSPNPTPLAAPPFPTGVTMTQVGSDPGGIGYDTQITTTIRWQAPLAEGTEVRVYGVTACLPPPGLDPAPCLVEHTPLPASVRELIATAPASAGQVTWTWPAWEDIGGDVMAHGASSYASIVVAAYDAARHSKFVIVATGESCSDCVY